jgi:uncharacterized repeat protein (TIGR01451 family)
VPQHAYATPGTYTVTLTVTDDAGLTSTVGHTVAVADAAPWAAFSVTTASPVAATPTSFSGAGSSDPDGSIAGYAWNFGDGSTGSGMSPSHTYGAAGTYTVALTVTDDAGLSTSASKALTVGYGNADLSVSISGASAKAGQYTYTVTVTNFGPSAAQGITLTNALDPSETLATLPTAPSGITCGGVGLKSTGTMTCTSAAGYQLASGTSFTVRFTVYLPSPSRVKTVTERSQVGAANPDPLSTNNSAGDS